MSTDHLSTNTSSTVNQSITPKILHQPRNVTKRVGVSQFFRVFNFNETVIYSIKMTSTQQAESKLDEKYMNPVVKFVGQVKNGKTIGSYNVALATVSLVEQITNEYSGSAGIKSAFELYEIIRQVGVTLSQALSQEIVALNIVKRILRGVRDEYKSEHSSDTAQSLHGLVLAAPPSRRKTLDPSDEDLKSIVKDYLAELRAELESSTSSICSTALEHVHANELILTYGASSITERFLKSCISRKYRLIVAESITPKESQAMAARLSNAGVSVTLIGNESIFSVMSRVNKVVIGVRAALAGGSVLGSAGMQIVTTAAKHYSVPVIALAPLYKLAPVYICDPRNFNSLGSVKEVLPYESLQSATCHVYGPMYDLVPSDHITLFITNIGGTSPSYIYRLLSELYDQKSTSF